MDMPKASEKVEDFFKGKTNVYMPYNVKVK